MTEEAPAHAPEMAIDQAFENLRREISLTRHAVEGLAAARERMPDYTETLAAIMASLQEAHAIIGRIEGSPAVQLSPAQMAAYLIKASAQARGEDARMLNSARDAISQSIGQIDAIVKRGRAADIQLFDRKLWACGGLVAGILLWAALPGAIARSLPQSWHVPEWMAARTIGLDKRAAGERMISIAEKSETRPR